jgi:cyanophycinase-like exopeptidase
MNARANEIPNMVTVEGTYRTYDDYDGVHWTVAAIAETAPEALKNALALPSKEHADNYQNAQLTAGINQILKNPDTTIYEETTAADISLDDKGASYQAAENLWLNKTSFSVAAEEYRLRADKNKYALETQITRLSARTRAAMVVGGTLLGAGILLGPSIVRGDSAEDMAGYTVPFALLNGFIGGMSGYKLGKLHQGQIAHRRAQSKVRKADRR